MRGRVEDLGLGRRGRGRGSGSTTNPDRLSHVVGHDLNVGNHGPLVHVLVTMTVDVNGHSLADQGHDGQSDESLGVHFDDTQR